MDSAMNKPERPHISHRYIQFVIDEKVSQKETQRITEHLKSCDRCQYFVEIMEEAREIAVPSISEPIEDHPSRSELSEILNQLYEQSLQPVEASKFLIHLKSCQKCFHYLESVFEETFSPLSENLGKELKPYSSISIATQVLNSIPPEADERVPFFRIILERLRKTFSFSVIPAPQLALAAVMVIIITVGSFWGLNFYKTTYKISQATSLLQKEYRIYMATTPRLSGGYASTGIRILMTRGDSIEATPSYLARAFDFTKQAIENGSKSSRAKQLQAQIFFIQNEYIKADSVLNQLEDKAQNTAEVLNDRGVLRFSQGDWQTAADYFKSAIQIDSTFKEAYYNIALAQDKLGEKEAAISTLKEYLALEKDLEWKNAAKRYLRKLQNEDG